LRSLKCRSWRRKQMRDNKCNAIIAELRYIALVIALSLLLLFLQGCWRM